MTNILVCGCYDYCQMLRLSVCGNLASACGCFGYWSATIDLLVCDCLGFWSAVVLAFDMVTSALFCGCLTIEL